MTVNETLINAMLTVIALLLSLIVQELRSQYRHRETIEKAKEQAVNEVLAIVHDNGTLDRRNHNEEDKTDA